MRALARWVQLWDRREPADALALVRIAIGLVLLGDLLIVMRFDLVHGLWAPLEEGGIGPFGRVASPSPILDWLGGSSRHVTWIYSAACLSAGMLCVGLFTRSSALLLLVTSAQLALLSPQADRGIDVLLRNALLVLACSGAGATWSLDARLRHRSFRRDVEVPAWPRYLLIVQLALLYFGAGMLKQSPPWTTLDGYSALYITLNQPHYATFSLTPEQLAPFYPLLQLATIVTVVFERAAIALPLLLWLRATAQRPGRLRRLVNRARLLELWIGIGVTFHLGLAATLELGMFPWGCLALYPALASPTSVRAAIDRAGGTFSAPRSAAS
jgi:hypothetical protein